MAPVDPLAIYREQCRARIRALEAQAAVPAAARELREQVLYQLRCELRRRKLGRENHVLAWLEGELRRYVPTLRALTATAKSPAAPRRRAAITLKHDASVSPFDARYVFGPPAYPTARGEPDVLIDPDGSVRLAPMELLVGLGDGGDME